MSLKKIFYAAGGAIVALGLSGKAEAQDNNCRLIQTGYASWYGEEMKKKNKYGKKVFDPTANGEEFDPSGVSAAHKTLPLPSKIKVIAKNGRVLNNVRVNDRGPFIKGRILDLSRGAAEKLGIKNSGGGIVSIYRCP